jgi:transcriptional antiterminator RfaH
MLGWYVMHSKPQKEKWLYDQLDALQIEAYCPSVRTKIGAQRSKPYFPGYLFVNVDLELTGISLLQWIPGSLGLVCFGGEPACVPDGLLQKIRHRVDQLNKAENSFFQTLKSGDEVIIHSGPFAGYEAIFCARLHDSERVQVFLKILQDHPVQVNLPVNQIHLTKQHRNLL